LSTASAAAVAPSRIASPHAGAKRPKQARGERPAQSRRRQAQERRPEIEAGLLPTIAGGLIWAVALCAATATSPFAAAAVVTPVGLVAAVSSARSVSRQRRTGQPTVIAVIIAAFVTLLVTAAALAGFPAAAGAAGAAVLIAVAASFYVIPGSRPGALAFALVAPAFACGSVVVAAAQGWNFGLTLVGTVCAYDFACWVNGTRRGVGGWTGVIAGVVTVGAAALFVAAVFVPPFSGWRPWTMLGLVGALCVAGVVLSGKTAGMARLPALRRIDSLVLAGPVWVAGVSLLLHR
jgi:hypothetical protein